MRLVSILGLVIANSLGFLLYTGPAGHRVAEIQQQLGELEQAQSSTLTEVAQWRTLHRLIDLARSMEDRIPVRDGAQLSVLQAAMLQAEEGLSIQRTSMQIRLEEEAPAGFRGFRTDLDAQGDFANLHAYLDRVSRLDAPMAPMEFSLVELDGPYRPPQVRLSATWSVLWPEEPRRATGEAEGSESSLPQGLSSQSLNRLEGWLERAASGAVGPPRRDIFQRARPEPLVTDSSGETSPRPSPEPPAPAPRLAGFVFRDDEAGFRKTLAAIRFADRVWLVAEGDRLGPYRVERIVEGEEVYLVEPRSGQGWHLTIE